MSLAQLLGSRFASWTFSCLADEFQQQLLLAMVFCGHNSPQVLLFFACPAFASKLRQVPE